MATLIKNSVMVVKTTYIKLFGVRIWERKEVIGSADPSFEIEINTEYFNSEFRLKGEE